MSAETIRQRVAKLHLDFDRSFAEPPRLELGRPRSLLAIRVAGDPYAVWLNQVTRLMCDRVVTPVLGPIAELLGVAAFHGAIIPVYDLRALLGYAASGTVRWLIVAAGATPVALAFDEFEGQVRVSSDAIASDEQVAGRKHLRGIWTFDGSARPIIDVASVIEAVAARAGRRASGPSPIAQKEASP